MAHARLGAKTAQALHAMGLRRLGQLFDAPRDALGKRFGPGLLRHMDRLRGAPDPMPLWTMLELTPEGRGTDWFPRLEYAD